MLCTIPEVSEDNFTLTDSVIFENYNSIEDDESHIVQLELI